MAIKFIPVDTGRLAGVMCLVAPEVKTDPTTGEIKLDKDGRKLWVVGVVLREPGSRKPSVIEVTTSTEPQGIGEGMPVRIMGLTASQWEMDGRSGISWKADEILSAGSGRAPAPAAPARGAVKGESEA